MIALTLFGALLTGFLLGYKLQERSLRAKILTLQTDLLLAKVREEKLLEDKLIIDKSIPLI